MTDVDRSLTVAARIGFARPLRASLHPWLHAFAPIGAVHTSRLNCHAPGIFMSLASLVRNASQAYDECRFVLTSRPVADRGEAVLPEFTPGSDRRS